MACLQVAALPIVPQHQCPLYLIPKTSFFLIHLCLSYFFSLTMITFLFFDSFFSLEAHPLFLNGFPSDKLFLFCFPERTDTLLTLEKKFEDRDLFFLECCEKHLAVLWLLLLLLATNLISHFTGSLSGLFSLFLLNLFIQSSVLIYVYRWISSLCGIDGLLKF